MILRNGAARKTDVRPAAVAASSTYASASGIALAPVATSYSRQSRPPQPKVSVVIPTLNEAANLPHVLPELPPFVDEVVIVDGHSTDDTVQTALRLRPDAHIVLESRRGKGAALRSGMAAATGDIVVLLDADGSNDPAEIPRFVGALVSGADFAKGSRFLQGGGTSDMPLYRKAGNRALVWLVRLFFGSNYSDLCYGYNAFWSDAVDRLDLDGDGFEIETMMNIRALRAGLSIVEVPSFEDARIHGTSNLQTVSDGWRVLRTILAERLRPLRAPVREARADASVETH